MKNELAIPPSIEVDFALNELSLAPTYTAVVVKLYYEVLKAHHQGWDIEEFLLALVYEDGGYPRSPGEETRQFILNGMNRAMPEYNLRTGFAYRTAKEDWYGNRITSVTTDRLVKAFNGYLKKYKKDITKVEDYKAQPYKDREQGRRVANEDMDAVFDANGRNRWQPEVLHTIMANFALDIDEPELAAYFTAATKSNSSKVKLYFRSLQETNAAEMKVHSMLEGLRDDLESDPVELCEFLIREIKEVGTEGGVDIDENVRQALILTGSQKLFPIERDYDTEEHAFKLGPFSETRYKLAQALLYDGQYDRAFEIVGTIPEGYNNDETRRMDCRQSLACDMHQIMAEKGQLDRKARKLVKESLIEYKKRGRIINKTNKKNGAIFASRMLALATEKETQGIRHYYSRKKISKARQLARNATSKFLLEARPEDRRKYEETFPDILAGYDLGPLRRVQLLALTADKIAADKALHELIEARNQTTLNKLIGATAMAAAFREQVMPDKEASISAEIELFAQEIYDSPGIPKQIVDRLEVEQLATKRVYSLIKKINMLPSAAGKKRCLDQLEGLKSIPEYSGFSVVLENYRRFLEIN